MATERKLSNRRKRASKGRAIRISDRVYNQLDRSRQGTMSWDRLLRRILGIPDRNGESQLLIEGYLELMTGRFFPKMHGMSWSALRADAYETAIMEAARRQTKKVAKPIRMREIP